MKSIFLTAALTIVSFLCAGENDVLSQTCHETAIDGKQIIYTAAVGSIPMRSEDGTQTGKIFYTYYHRENVETECNRPVTFAFNGGPGSSSVWLHMGAFGPKRIPTNLEGQGSLPPYQWIENSDSILDLTDLVFIDPIGTGLSRPVKSDDTSCYDIQGDIRSIGDFIQDFVTREGRWKSPKYIAGESYGAFRACGVAKYLLSRYNLFLNGLILISCAIDFQALSFSLDNELPYAFFFPSYAAAAWYHRRLDQSIGLEDTVQEAKSFAINVLAPSLLREGRVPPCLYPDIAKWTGLSIDLVEKNDGMIDDGTFFLALLQQEKKVIGRFDSRFSGQILPPRNAMNYNDPSYSAIGGAFAGTFHAYMQEELDCRSDWPRYEILASLPWNFNTCGYPGAMNCLREAFVMNPGMRVFAACGYYDLATPLAATEHCFRRLHLPLEGNISFGYYEGGHMFYINPAALRQFKLDLTKFFENP